MSRLSVRLVLSHLAVALLGAGVTYVVVRQLAPGLAVDPMGPGSGPHPPAGMPAPGPSAVRAAVAAAIDTAVLWGCVVGVIAATGVGALAAYRLLKPLRNVRRAARHMSRGRYGEEIPLPREQELADLVRDVNRLGRELARTEQTRVRLLGEVAHEMRTPLTVIDGYVEGMIDGLIPTGRAELGQVSGEIRRLRRLTEDLAALSRAEEDQFDLRRSPLDLRELVLDQGDRLRAQAAGAGLTFTTDGPAAPVPVSADADRIVQVVTNLVGNAIRATAPGGRITVTVGNDGITAWIRVADTGEGLRAQDLVPVFDRFYRVEGRRRGLTDAGTGIGLTISRSIMRGHGGDLVADSAGPGRGATFTATLPLSYVVPPAPSTRPTPPAMA